MNMHVVLQSYIFNVYCPLLVAFLYKTLILIISTIYLDSFCFFVPSSSSKRSAAVCSGAVPTAIPEPAG